MAKAENETKLKMADTSGAGVDVGKGEKCKKYSDLCWKCSKKKSEVAQLYKCGGCKTARYCSDACRDEDWEEHGTWCGRKQRKRREKKEAKKVVE